MEATIKRAQIEGSSTIFSFSPELIKKYQEESGDYNPIHWDAEWFKANPLFVRITGINKPVVPGLLLVKEIAVKYRYEEPFNKVFFLAKGYPYLKGLTAKFSKPIFFGERINFSVVSELASAGDGAPNDELTKIHCHLFKENGDQAVSLEGEFGYCDDQSSNQNNREPIDYSFPLIGIVWKSCGDGSILYYLKSKFLAELKTGQNFDFCERNLTQAIMKRKGGNSVFTADLKFTTPPYKIAEYEAHIFTPNFKD